ncbi:hybrid sensor histidine kinase/response regulator [Paenibacillus humicus]|uniref:hybrid sensor histidine kinase/response regulator n=1 Tax=Paenibacillus humicus TaxID=412861 RepID=UPI0013E2C392|nr:histidine kinase [Paenibacillus humicus]
MRRVAGIIFLVVSLSIWIPLGISSERGSEPNRLRAEKGVLDLAGWDGSGRIALNGEWEFYWNELLAPGEASRQGEPAWMEVPGAWNDRQASGDEMPAYGAATYRLRLLHVPESGVYAIKKTNIRFASEIYINGKKVLIDGVPALSEDAYVPGNSPRIAAFELERGEAEIVVHASNYDYLDSGIPMPIYFGKQEAVRAAHERSLLGESTMAVVLTVVGLIHLVLFAAVWLYGQRDYSLLLFGLTCFGLAVFNGLLGERPLTLLLDGLSFQTLYTIKDMSSLAGFIVSVYLLRLLQGDRPNRWLRLFVLALLVSLLLFPFLDIREYLLIYQLIIFAEQLLMVWLFWSAAAHYARASRAKRYEALLLLLAVLLLILYSICCWLFGLSLLNSLLLTQIYVVLFSLVVFLIIVYRFYSAFREMDHMHRKLLRLDRQKDEFLSSTTYQLRAPLQDIVHLADSVAKSTAIPPGSGPARSLELIAGTGRKLGYLVQDLHDFSRLKHEDIQPELRNLDLRSAVESVLGLHRSLLGRRPVLLLNGVKENMAAVYADEDRLVQILHRLVGQAAFRAEEGRIEIDAEEQGGFAVVTIRFIGKRKPMHSDERFIADPPLSGEDSADLALLISRRLIELQGGRVLQPAPGEAELPFRFALLLEAEHGGKPARRGTGAKEPAAAAHFLQAARDGRQRPAVLVADPDTASLHAISQLLEQEGLRVEAVHSAKQMREALGKERELCLVLLGVSLTDGSGYEALQEARERFSPSELPVLMLTGRRREEDRKLALDLGANDYVAKPFEAEELLARVRSLVKLRQSVKEAREREIAFLRSQINPHFLYNALGAIAELCVEDPAKAEKLTMDLSGYLRGSFDFRELDSLSSLGAEMKLIEAYAEIEKARFGSRLKVSLRCDADPGLRFPPLLLQPLVENAIRHGLLSRGRGGEVKVTISEREGFLHAAVEDDGAGFDAEAMYVRLQQPERIGGVGLWNVSERLRLLYGEKLDLTSRAGQGSRLAFRVPVAARSARGYDKGG